MALAARDSGGRPQLVPASSPALGPLRAVLLALAGLCFIAVAARFLAAPLDRFDEGLTLTKAALVAQGLIADRGVWSPYGPLALVARWTRVAVTAVGGLLVRG